MEKSDGEKRKKAYQEYLEKVRKEHPRVNFILDITDEEADWLHRNRQRGEDGDDKEHSKD